MWRENICQIIERPSRAFALAVILGSIPIFFFHCLSLLLMIVVTLREGAQKGIGLAIAIAIITALQLKLFLHLPFAQISLAILSPLCLWLMALVLRYKAGWSHVFELVTLIGVLVVLGAYKFFPQLTIEWNLFFTKLLEQAIQTPSSLLHDVDSQQLQKMIVLFGQFGTGLRALKFSALLFITLVVGRSIQATLYNPGGLKKEFYQWHLTRWFTIVLALLMLLPTTVHQPVCFGLLPVLGLAPACVGLSVIHSYTARFKYQWAILLIFYLAIPFVTQLLLVVIFIGMLDSFINFRVRFSSFSRG